MTEYWRLCEPCSTTFSADTFVDEGECSRCQIERLTSELAKYEAFVEVAKRVIDVAYKYDGFDSVQVPAKEYYDMEKTVKELEAN